MRTQRQPVRALDKLDHKILRLLQQDGRMAMKDLAEQVGLSVTPCIERVKRMERDGVITGYHARVNPAELGAALLVFVEITLDHKSGNMFDQFRREVQKIPEVLECHLVSGDFDYLIKARIGEMADYRKLLGDILLQLPGAVQSNLITLTEPNVSSPPARSRSTWYEATVMSAERIAASSRVRFDVTGCPFVLLAGSARNSRQGRAVDAAGGQRSRLTRGKEHT